MFIRKRLKHENSERELTPLGASPLDPSRGLSRCALWCSFTFNRLDHCQCRARAASQYRVLAVTNRCSCSASAALAVVTVTTPCSQPLCAGLRSNVTHDIGSVTDIPELTCDLYSSMMLSVDEAYDGIVLCTTGQVVSFQCHGRPAILTSIST